MCPNTLPVLHELLPEIIALRHELHQHPEIHLEEHWTSDRIAQFLEQTGIPFKQGYVGGTGIIATLNTGRPGPIVAFRADMDALNIQEATGLPYASTIPGMMHACGHDGHMAALCGAAKVFSRMRDELTGVIRFIFQPGEESVGGGRRMVVEGAVEGVDAVFALHAWPSLPVGRIGLCPGPAMGSADFFRIDVCGTGCHGADPGTGVDPVIAAAHIITALQTILSRELNPWEAGVVTVSCIEAGTAPNIIPDRVLLEGTVRALSLDGLHRVMRAVERIATQTALAFRATANVRFGNQVYPPVINPPEMVQYVAETAAETLGLDRVIPVDHPSMTAEDFAFYLQQVPGVFLWLGNAQPGKSSPPLHSAKFDFNDDALPTAINLWVALAQRFPQWDA